jgi:hypothetical protein
MTQTDPYDEHEGAAHHGKKRKRHTKKGLIPEFLSNVKRGIDKACKRQHEVFWGKDKK